MLVLETIFYPLSVKEWHEPYLFSSDLLNFKIS